MGGGAPGGRGWLDSLTVSTGLGNEQRVFVIAKNGGVVKVHPLVASAVCRNVLDTLIFIAEAFPGRFVPVLLRGTDTPKDKESCEPLESIEFWQLVYKSVSFLVIIFRASSFQLGYIRNVNFKTALVEKLLYSTVG